MPFTSRRSTFRRDARLSLRLTASRWAVATATACALGSTAHGQTIVPRTVPVLMSQQFEFFPADRDGMGGVTIALDDELLDPFVNPAKALRVKRTTVSIAPYFHKLSENRGGGRTLPISGVGSRSGWGYGGIFALQQLDRARLTWNPPLSERTAANQYLSALVARDLGRGFTVGASGYTANLEAELGVDQLYSGSDRILQAGSAADLRLGLTREWGADRAFELMVLRSRFDMTHDVHWPGVTTWRPPGVQVTTPERQEQYRDHTSLWGAHSEYSTPIGTEGWRIGWLGTVNRLSHPKIPDYRVLDVMTVPRDPGHTWAYNAGMGLSRHLNRTTFGFDVVLEPMYSTTWAEAARDTADVHGGTIVKGAHTVDNEFRFSNAAMRFGFEQLIAMKDSVNQFGVQFGLGVYSIRYRLDQSDLVRDERRTQNEHWMEWTPTLGLSLRGPSFDVRYAFSFTCGGGGSDCVPCPFGCGDDVTVTAPPPAAGGGVIAAPTSALRFNGGRVTMQRLTFSFRIR